MRSSPWLVLMILSVSCADAGGGAEAPRPPGAGGGPTGSSGASCQGLECLRMDCGAGKPRTSVSGRITAPNGIDPVHDALVYVPQGVSEFPPAVQCEVCDQPLGGAPVAVTHSSVDGTFRLEDVPVTGGISVVVQKGRFRKILSVSPAACSDTPLSADQTRLPRNQNEGSLPKMAVGLGDYDQIECVLRSIGIDLQEFTPSSGKGAVHLYGNTAGGEFEALLSDLQKLQQYNLVFINCSANLFDHLSRKDTIAQNLYDYVNAGGRLYVTDWSYDYLEQVSQFSPYIYFANGGSMTLPQPPHAAAFASQTQPFDATVDDPTLADWLRGTGAIQGSTVVIQDLIVNWVLMQSAMQPGYPAQTWVSGFTHGANRPLTVTFDYNGCGKVLYSSYHTREPGGANLLGASFPGYCKSTATTMIAQEKILEYLIFQISSCVGPIL